MSGNPLVRFDEGKWVALARCRPLSYSTDDCRCARIMPVAENGEYVHDPDRYSHCLLDRSCSAQVLLFGLHGSSVEDAAHQLLKRYLSEHRVVEATVGLAVTQGMRAYIKCELSMNLNGRLNFLLNCS